MPEIYYENPMTTARSLPETETGILPSSNMYLHLPSAFARNALFYAPYVGHFHLTSAYHVERGNYEYYLLILIDSGSLLVTFQQQTFVARARDIVLIDCKHPHAYRALENSSFRYFHFDGASSGYFYDFLVRQYGYLLHPEKQMEIENAMNRLISLAYNGFENEQYISIEIHRILSELVQQNVSAKNPQDTAVNQAISFMEKHFAEDISLEQLSEIAGLSPYYFSRIFHRYTGDSPHSYLVRLRITQARQLLAASDISIEYVCDACGFHSVQHFTRAFKQHVGCAPRDYRKRTKLSLSHQKTI